MKNIPLVSVIIPVYNRANILPRTIKSVSNQEFQDFEIIIINDCSTDSTSTVIATLEKLDDRIKATSTDTNSGPAAARNIGLKLAQGKYVAFLELR